MTEINDWFDHPGVLTCKSQSISLKMSSHGGEVEIRINYDSFHNSG